MRASVPEKSDRKPRGTRSQHRSKTDRSPRAKDVALASTPLAQLLPHLHERLHLPRARQPAVDHSAIPIRRLIKISNRPQAQMCEVVAQFLQVLLAQHVHLLAIRTPGHGENNASIFAIYSPIDCARDSRQKSGGGSGRDLNVV